MHEGLRRALIWTAAFTLGSLQCQQLSAQSRDAEPATRAANDAFVKSLPFVDLADFDDAKRGLIATLPDGVIAGVGGKPAWDKKPYAFLQKDAAPATVNPSLWRQAQLNAVHGLFKVTERVYQVRGLDLANLTIVEGDAGLILIDPLLSTESIDLAFDFLGLRLNAAKAEGKRIVVNWTFTDRNETYVMNLENSALTHRAGKLDDNADAGVKLTRATLDAITLKQRTFVGSVLTGDVSVSGNPLKLRELFGLLDEFTPDFEIIEPKKASVD